MKIVKNILPSLFAILFLLLSFNVSINKMVCLKSGFTTVSIANNKDCCKEESNRSIVKATCCDVLNFSINLKEYNFVQRNDIPNAAVLTVALCNYGFIPPEHSSVFIANTTTNHQLSFLYGRGLLSFISILVI